MINNTSYCRNCNMGMTLKSGVYKCWKCKNDIEVQDIHLWNLAIIRVEIEDFLRQTINESKKAISDIKESYIKSKCDYHKQIKIIENAEGRTNKSNDEKLKFYSENNLSDEDKLEIKNSSSYKFNYLQVKNSENRLNKIETFLKLKNNFWKQYKFLLENNINYEIYNKIYDSKLTAIQNQKRKSELEKKNISKKFGGIQKNEWIQKEKR